MNDGEDSGNDGEEDPGGDGEDGNNEDSQPSYDSPAHSYDDLVDVLLLSLCEKLSGAPMYAFDLRANYAAVMKYDFLCRRRSRRKRKTVVAELRKRYKMEKQYPYTCVVKVPYATLGDVISVVKTDFVAGIRNILLDPILIALSLSLFICLFCLLLLFLRLCRFQFRVNVVIGAGFRLNAFISSALSLPSLYMSLMLALSFPETVLLSVSIERWLQSRLPTDSIRLIHF